MIIYSGLGILVPLIAIASLFGFDYLFNDIIYHDPRFIQTHTWAQLVGVVVASVTCFFLGKVLDGWPGKLMIDKETGQERRVGGHHTFFFIPMHWWGFIFLAYGTFRCIR